MASWLGWFTVSQSKTINCIERESSNILSISACTSAKLFDLEFDFSSMARFDGLFSTDFLPSEMSADTLVMIIRPSNLFFRNSNTAFCIISVTS